MSINLQDSARKSYVKIRWIWN